MKKAVIGVTPLWDRDRDSYWMLPGYLEGLELAGALPIILPLTESNSDISRLVSLCDGFLFTGGQDVSPKLYGEKPRVTCGEICEKRDTFEQRLFTQSLEQDKPMLGICRGIQFFNACLGGTLYQDLPTEHPSEVAHVMRPPYDQIVHSVALLPGTPLAALLGRAELGVNSYHHQAIKVLAPGLAEIARSEDGLVEAVYIPDKSLFVRPENTGLAEQWRSMETPGRRRRRISAAPTRPGLPIIITSPGSDGGRKTTTIW